MDIITAGLVPVLQSMKTRNDGTECVKKPMRTQFSTPPTHSADLLAHRQSENPMAQTSDGSSDFACSVGSDNVRAALKASDAAEHTNIFSPDLIRVSPNASDGQRLGRCVLALKLYNQQTCLHESSF